MPRTFANIIDLAEQKLQDTANAVWDSTELGLAYETVIQEYSDIKPYVRRETYDFETRYGAATSTTTGALVDATKSQFLAGDVGKVIHNTYDHTWAIVTAYVSATQLTLSKDIMASGEAYKIYNNECGSIQEVNIEDIDDYIRIDTVEYPVGGYPPNNRTFIPTGANGKILRIDLDNYALPDTNSTVTPPPNKEIWVFFALNHFVSQLTDFAGTVNGALSAGGTTVTLAGLQSSGTIKKGQEITFASTRGVYRVTTDTTISSSAASNVPFYPALESGVADGAVVTFVKSTLKPDDEIILAEMIAGEAAISKANLYYQQTITAVSTLSTASTSIGNMSARITQAITDISSGRTEADKLSGVIEDASAEIDKMAARITQAIADVASGRTEGGKLSAIIDEANTAIDTMTAKIAEAESDLEDGRMEADKLPSIIDTASKEMDKVTREINEAIADLDEGRTKIGDFSPDAGQFASYTNTGLNNARSILEAGQGYLNEANVREGNVSAHTRLATGELSLAASKLNQAIGYVREANAREGNEAAYLRLADEEIKSARVALEMAQGYFRQANTIDSTVASYGRLASGELSSCSTYLNQGIGYIRKANAEFAASNSIRNMQAWGQYIKDNALRKLRTKVKPRSSRKFTLF